MGKCKEASNSLATWPKAIGFFCTSHQCSLSKYVIIYSVGKWLC